MKHLHLPWVIFVSSEMAHYFLGQCKLGKQAFGACESSWACCLGRCPVVCFPCSWAFPGDRTHDGMSSRVALLWAVVGFGIRIQAGSAVFLVGSVFLHGLAQRG